jgi:hypothetical protein
LSDGVLTLRECSATMWTMTKTTKEIMRKLRRKLTKLIDMEITSCGWPESLAKAATHRVEMENELELAIEDLARKAGVE